MLCCFFFKQKTAYDVRISDWSSDVCSSDLHRLKHQLVLIGHMHMEIRLGIGQENRHGLRQAESDHRQSMMPGRWRQLHRFEGPVHGRADIMLTVDRSEEHTSELQSLMRISYAVFCLKKKIKSNEDECIP